MDFRLSRIFEKIQKGERELFWYVENFHCELYVQTSGRPRPGVSVTLNPQQVGVGEPLASIGLCHYFCEIQSTIGLVFPPHPN